MARLAPCRIASTPAACPDPDADPGSTGSPPRTVLNDKATRRPAHHQPSQSRAESTEDVTRIMHAKVEAAEGHGDDDCRSGREGDHSYSARCIRTGRDEIGQ